MTSARDVTGTKINGIGAAHFATVAAMNPKAHPPTRFFIGTVEQVRDMVGRGWKVKAMGGGR